MSQARKHQSEYVVVIHQVKSFRGTTPASFTVEQDFTTEGVDLNNVFNVLLLGETGVGKTTFVNSFANYVKYGSMDEALKKGPVILIKSSITISSNTEDEPETNVTFFEYDTPHLNI